MSLKSIEMQIAIPRTNEVTPIQNQLNQKPHSDQAALASAAMKQAEAERKKSVEVNPSSHLNVGDDGGPNQQGRQGAKSRKGGKRHSAASSENMHPFKGKHIDISL